MKISNDDKKSEVKVIKYDHIITVEEDEAPEKCKQKYG